MSLVKCQLFLIIDISCETTSNCKSSNRKRLFYEFQLGHFIAKAKRKEKNGSNFDLDS
jgi:hypothetical protein